MLESLFDKVAALKAYNFIKKRLGHSCFTVKFLRTSFFYRAPLVATSRYCSFDCRILDKLKLGGFFMVFKILTQE